MVIMDDDESRQLHLLMNACIKVFYRYTVMGINVEDYPDKVSSVSEMAQNVVRIGSNDGENFIKNVNAYIPDEPLTSRIIAIVPDNKRSIPVSFKDRASADNTPENITFVLVNCILEREITQVYPASRDTRYPTGMIIPEDTEA